MNKGNKKDRRALASLWGHSQRTQAEGEGVSEKGKFGCRVMGLLKPPGIQNFVYMF